jgi:hypothetical protein
VAALGDQVVVDVDHPADDPLEQTFGSRLQEAWDRSPVVSSRCDDAVR